MNYNTGRNETLLPGRGMRVPIKIRLAQLEDRLQALIEGSAARLFPSNQSRNDLAQRLVAAMRANIQTDETGNLLAPNLFTLVVHPVQVQALRDQKAILEELERDLKQSGEESGFLFPSSPTIKILEASGSSPQEIRILAQFNTEQLSDTSVLELEAEENGVPPAGAFLIVEGSQVFPLTTPIVNIGRQPANHLVIQDPRVSRSHAQLRHIKGRYVIFDLNSTGGTFINQKRIGQSILYPGDVICLAGTQGVQLIFGQDGWSSGGGTQKYPAAPGNLA